MGPAGTALGAGRRSQAGRVEGGIGTGSGRSRRLRTGLGAGHTTVEGIGGSRLAGEAHTGRRHRSTLARTLLWW